METTKTEEKEILFYNGKIFTAKNETDFCNSFMIKDGFFEWTGNLTETEAIDLSHTKNIEAIDLKGQTILPSFLDVHTHPTYIATILTGIACTIPKVNNIDEMINALKTHSNYGKGPNDWILGWGYDESKLAEHRTPNRNDLDKVSKTQPVFVLRSDVHSGICNSRALEIAKITKDTKDPPGAKFGRFEDNEPSGELIELSAKERVEHCIEEPCIERDIKAIFNTSNHFNQRGISAVTDMMIFRTPTDQYKVFKEAEKMGFCQQACLYMVWTGEDDEFGMPDLKEEEKRGRIKIAGLKLFADGSISGRTAFISSSYKGDKESHGIYMLNDKKLTAAWKYAKRNKIQIAIHVMGDKSIENIINFFSDKEPWMDGDIPSVRLEHVSLLREDQIKKMNSSKMKWGITTQIIFYFAELDSYTENLEKEELERVYPVKTFYNGMEAFGLSSDTPATTWADPDDVFVSLQAAVERKAYNKVDIVPSQSISIEQAILLYTSKAAHVAPYENLIGQISKGFEASFNIIDNDIFSLPKDKISTTKVSEAWICGNKVYSRK